MQGRLVPPVEDRIQCFPRSELGGRVRARRRGRARLHRVDLRRVRRRRQSDRDRRGIEPMLELSERHRGSASSRCARTTSWIGRWFGRPRAELDERVAAPGLADRAVPADSASSGSSCRSSTRRGSRRTRSSDRSSRRSQTCARDGGRRAASSSTSRRRSARTRFAELLARLPRELVKVNYDIGNSASLGYDPRDEFAAYGDRVGSVHIKDRRRGRTTVPLGTGDADFPAVFDCLRALAYARRLRPAGGARRPGGRGRVGATEPINGRALRRRRRAPRCGMRFLVVGLGGIGQRHVRNLRTLLGSDVEILAYRVRRDSPTLTRQPERGARCKTSRRSTDIRVFDDLDAALAERPDAVLVCNPSSLHLPVALKAARAGCALFIEKPLSRLRWMASPSSSRWSTPAASSGWSATR